MAEYWELGRLLSEQGSTPPVGSASVLPVVTCNLNMLLVLMRLSFPPICPMGTRLVSPAEGFYEEVMRSGVLVKAAFQHGGGVSRREVRAVSM